MSFPVISSNTLFHFTNKREHLINILKNNFRPRYCLEMYSTLLGYSAFWKTDFAFPMTCFCDIPLSNIGKHLGTYGNYGIGLTKEWGMEKGLNPVLYIQKDSSLWKAFMRSTVAFSTTLLEAGEEKERLGEFMTTSQLFTKPYIGPFLRGNNVIENVKFYDEREWRFVPRPENNEYYHMKLAEYNIPEWRESSNESLPSSATLEFTPDDIRYIVVERENEILSMVDEVMQIKGANYDDDKLKVLTTRIISAEQIRKDF